MVSRQEEFQAGLSGHQPSQGTEFGLHMFVMV